MFSHCTHTHTCIIIIFRFLILRKKPTVLKVVAAGCVVVGLILSLIPVISGMDKDSAHGKQEYLKQPTASRILWPFCFMIGFVSDKLLIDALVMLMAHN